MTVSLQKTLLAHSHRETGNGNCCGLNCTFSKAVKPLWGKIPHILILTLDINGLNTAIKIHRLPEWIFLKNEPTIYWLQETHLAGKDTYRLKVKGLKKIFHASRNQKQVGVAMLISDKTGQALNQKQ